MKAKIRPTIMEKWMESFVAKFLGGICSKIFDLSTEYSRTVMAVFAALCIFFAAGNVYNIVGDFSGGIVDNNVLEPNDPVVQGMKFVKLFENEGLESAEVLAWILPAGNLKDGQEENLLVLERIHKELVERFPECGIVSLTNFPNPRLEVQEGEEVFLISSFVDEELLERIRKREASGFEGWRVEMEKKSGPKGLLYAADQSFLRIVVALPSGYHEMQSRDRVASYLEQRRITWYHWFIRKDIHPTGFYQDVKVVGWVIGRGIMSAALIFAVLMLSTIGLIMAYRVSWQTLRSPKQALIVIGSIIASLVWIRGTVGWMNFFHAHFGLFEFWGESPKERVYILLVFTSLIIAGISFKIRPFEMYNELRKNRSDLSPKQCWQRVRIDLLGKASVVFLIAFANFMTLYQIGNRGIMEVGVLSAIGLVQVLFLTFIVIPAAHICIGGEANEQFAHYSQWKIWGWMARHWMGRVASTCLTLLNWFAPKAKIFGKTILVLFRALFLPVANFLRRIYLGWLVDLALYFSYLATSDGWNKWIDRRIESFYNFLTRMPPKSFPALEKRVAARIFVLPLARVLARILMPFTAAKAIVVTSILVLSAGSIVAVDYFFHQDRMPEGRLIVVNENPIDYLPGTNFSQGCDIVNAEGTGTAQGRLPFWIFPRDLKYVSEAPGFDENNPEHWEKLYGQVKLHDESGYDPVENPDFIGRVRELQDKMAEIGGSRQVWSILNGLEDYSRALWGRDLPKTSQEVSEALSDFERKLLESPNGDLVKRMNWFSRGISLSSFLPANSSYELRMYRKQVMEIAKKDFPDLIVVADGKLHLYAQSDMYISQGKPKNMLTSFYWVVLICGLWIKIKNWLSWREHNEYTLSAPLTGFAMAIPFLFSFSIIAIVMALFRVPLDQGMACATALGINAAIDFDVYFVADYHQALLNGVISREELLRIALREKGRLIFIDMMVNAICFAPLMLAPFLPIVRLGQVMVLMMFTCGIGALVIMPAALSVCVVKTKKLRTEVFAVTKRITAKNKMPLRVSQTLRSDAKRGN